MTEEEVNRLTGAWIDYWERWKNLTRAERLMDDSGEWIDELISPAYDCDPEGLWQFIQTAYKREMSDRLFAVLAAGPLEDLLCDHGPDFIDRVETEARQNPRFRELLGGVWCRNMAADVWERIGKYRGPTW